MSCIRFSRKKIGCGTRPVKMTIAHAFNYRMAVLRNGEKWAVRVARARKVEECFLLNSDIQWGQQVAVMFQIVSTMALELPSFLEGLAILKGMSPNVQLTFEPWGMIIMRTLIMSANHLTGRRLMCMI